MKKILTLLLCSASFFLYGQGTIEAEDGIIVGNNSGTTNGTIRYTGADLEARVAGVWTSLTGGGGSSVWNTNGTTAYYNAGGVGIGTDILKSNVHIKNGSAPYAGAINSVVDLLIEGSGQTFMEINGNIWAGYSFAGSGQTLRAGMYYNYGGDDVRFRSGGSDRVTIDPNGYVGIGTIAPAKHLDLATNGADIRFSNSNFSAIQWYEGASEVAYLTHNGNDVILQNSDTGYLELEATSGDVDIKTGGTVNVIGGDTYLGQELYVGQGTPNGNTWTMAAFQNPSTGVGGGFKLQAADSGFAADDGAQIAISNGVDPNLDIANWEPNGGMAFKTGSSYITRMSINSTGQVAIGTVAVPSGYRFAVDGKVICEELRVDLSGTWPDYVFADDYNMMSLPELEKYIETNNHLPNIPAAAEMEESGIAVGEMQRKMMEKIEELTLYILQQQKEIDALKAEANKDNK